MLLLTQARGRILLSYVAEGRLLRLPDHMVVQVARVAHMLATHGHLAGRRHVRPGEQAATGCGRYRRNWYRGR